MTPSERQKILDCLATASSAIDEAVGERTCYSIKVAAEEGCVDESNLVGEWGGYLCFSKSIIDAVSRLLAKGEEPTGTWDPNSKFFFEEGGFGDVRPVAMHITNDVEGMTKLLAKYGSDQGQRTPIPFQAFFSTDVPEFDVS